MKFRGYTSGKPFFQEECQRDASNGPDVPASHLPRNIHVLRPKRCIFPRKSAQYIYFLRACFLDVELGDGRLFASFCRSMTGLERLWRLGHTGAQRMGAILVRDNSQLEVQLGLIEVYC